MQQQKEVNMNKENKKLNIAIIGQGRFGKLMADILKSFGDVFIISSRKLDGDNMKQIDFADIERMDWVIPCVPISAMQDTLKKIKPFIKKGSLIMDVCSVKVMPCEWMRGIIPEDIEIIGTHPMFGPDSASNGLKGLQVVICPIRSSNKTLGSVIDIFKEMKLKVIEVSPKEHDRQVAVSLALVHTVGRGLARAEVGKQKITTLGFERLLAVNENVNNDTWQLFLDMQHYNPYADKIRKKFINSLIDIDKEIEDKK